MVDTLLIEGREVPQPSYDHDAARLADYYRKALLSLQKEFDRVDVKGFSRAQSLAMLKEVEKTLRELDREAIAWINEHIPAAAHSGAASTLVSLGLAETIEEAEQAMRFNQLDKKITEIAVADMQEDLLAITNKIEARVRVAVRQAVAESIRANMTQGINSNRNIKKAIEEAIRQRLKDSINDAIIDAAGRRWQASVYAELVARTKSLETYREAKTYEALNRGSSYAIITTNGGTKDACRFHEGRIIKLDPSAEGSYMTYDEIKASNQCFHPNCKHHFLPFRRFDRLPKDVQEKAKEQEALGRAAMNTGKRAPDEETVKQTLN